MRAPVGLRELLTLLFALGAIALALDRLHAVAVGCTARSLAIDETPATFYRLEGAPPGPVVVIAHGFAGSQTLMRSLALTLAGNGIGALTFDFLGHGRHPRPLDGDLRTLDGATARLVAQLRAVIDRARALGDGRVALLGHSMAGDLIVRAAVLEPDVRAVVAISMLSPAVTATTPRNLLAIAGELEGGLAREALRVAGLVSAPEPPAERVTYGRLEDGTARRAVLAPGVEHVGVLFSTTTLAETQAWLDAAFGRTRSGAPFLAQRGPWLVLLLAGCIGLAWPLLSLLPRLPDRPAETALPWRRLLTPLAVGILLPALALRALRPDFLPIALVDQLAAQTGLFGLLLLSMVRRATGPAGHRPPAPPLRLLLASAGACLAIVLPTGLAVDAELTDLPATEARLPVMVALATGALPYFLALEVAGRGPGAARGAPPTILLCLLLSLALAIALDPERLLFLGALAIVLVPVLLATLLLGRWARQAIGHPLPGALACALLLGWLVGGVVPLLADR